MRDKKSRAPSIKTVARSDKVELVMLDVGPYMSDFLKGMSIGFTAEKKSAKNR